MIYEAPFLIKTQEIPIFFLLTVTKKSHLSARAMARTVQLLRRDAYCPILTVLLRLKSGQLIANQI